MSLLDVAKYQSMFQGYQPSYQPAGALGRHNPLLAMGMQFASPMIESNFGLPNGLVMSQFMPTQNLYDQMRARQYSDMQQKVIEQASKHDHQAFSQIFTGVSNIAGTPDNPRRQQSIDRLTNQVMSIMPLLAQFSPDLVDSMHGRRGSAMLMAQALHRSGQSSVDPVTGRIGITGQSASIMAREIFNNLFGPDANLDEMRGLGAGRAGSLYEQMALRGIGGTSTGTMSDQERLEILAGTDNKDLVELANRSGVHSSRLRKTKQQAADKLAFGDFDLSKLDSEATSEMLSSFDATRVSNRIKEMAGAVDAMREIFGDAGNPNAPMQELMAGLEALTQNGTVTQSPANLERLVRTTQAAARNAGISMEGVLGLTANGANLADQLGLDRGFATQATTQSLSFGAAAGSTAALDTPAFGSLNREKMMLMDQQLRLRAAASPFANRMNAVLRLVEQGVASGPAADVATAIKEGRLSDVQAKIGSQAQFVELMAKSGVTHAEAAQAARDTYSNQEYGLKYNTTDLARKAQGGTDVQRLLSHLISNTARSALDTTAMTDEQRRDATRQAGNAASEALLGMSPEDQRNTDKRNQIVADAVEKQLRTSFAASGVNMTDPELKSISKRIAVGGWSNADQYLSRDPQYGGMGILGTLQMHNPRTIRAQQQAMRQAESEAAMATALGGLGQGDPIANLTDALREAKPSDPIGKLFAKMLNGVDANKIADNDIVLRAFKDSMEQYANAETQNGQLTPAGDLQRMEASKMISALRTGGEAAKSQLQQMAKDLGLTDASELTEQAIRSRVTNKTDADRMVRQRHALEESVTRGGADERLKRAGFNMGNNLTDEEKAKGLGRIMVAADNDDLAVDLGKGKVAVNQRNMQAFSGLAAYAEKFKKELGFKDITNDNVDEAIETLIAKQGSIGAGQREQAEIKALQKAVIRDSDRNKMQLTGSLQIKGLKNALVEATASTSGINESPMPSHN